MADQKPIWLYIYEERHDYDGPAFIAFSKKEAAYAHAADVIKRIALDERTRYAWEPDDTNLEELDEILLYINKGEFENALGAWDHYQGEYDHDEKVDVREIQLHG